MPENYSGATDQLDRFTEGFCLRRLHSAKTMLRSLIDEIRITPGAKRGECCLELVGKLATILNISQDAKNKGGTHESSIQASVVAGARNSYCSHGLGSDFEDDRGRVPGIVQDSMQI